MNAPVSGALGTAQVTNRPDDGWFAGWVAATGSHGPLVVVVRVTEGGFGDTSAAPVARQLFSQWTTGRPGPWESGGSAAGQ
jgi:cell division protein FtsI/penicillin-binding protein 2